MTDTAMGERVVAFVQLTSHTDRSADPTPDPTADLPAEIRSAFYRKIGGQWEARRASLASSGEGRDDAEGSG